MKKKFISIFFVLFAMVLSSGMTVSASTCFADSRKYEMETSGVSIDRVHFKVRDGITARLDEMALKLKAMGFEDKVIARYLFTNYEDVIRSLQNENIEVINSNIIVEKDRVYPTKESNGKMVQIDKLDSLIVSKVLLNEPFLEIPFQTIEASTTYNENINYCNLKSHFTTPIRGLNQEGRIHNIGVALSKFDGMRIEPNQIVSFNNIIGNTTEENGYALAKVIINGKYEDDYGGGVCQASTTLYNALLLADVEIIQANPHSLKVGYVEGAFDAMVSFGLSDLVFKNNTGGPLFITTFCNGDSCGANIFGTQNEYDIVRRSETVDFDSEKLPRVSSKYEGFLDYYKNGKKQFEKRIRKDNYYKLNAQSV